jgi:four helix bundle protein
LIQRIKIKTMHNYKELKVWQKSIRLISKVYKITKSFPSDEKFGLTSQIRRSAVSVASNIAEGGGRRTDGEFLNFLGIAHGSICELETQLYVAFDLGYLENSHLRDISNDLTEIQKMLYVLINKFEQQNTKR